MCLRAQQPLWQSVIMQLKKPPCLSFLLQAVGQKSWSGWGDRAGNRRNPDGVWRGFLWLFPRSPGMSSPRPALGYLTGRDGQKERFKVMTKSLLCRSSSGWCSIALFLFCFDFITLWKDSDVITGSVLHVTSAHVERKLLLKVPTDPEDKLFEEVSVRQSRLFLKRTIENWKFGVWHLIWKLYVFVWNVLRIWRVVLLQRFSECLADQIILDIVTLKLKYR